MSANETEVDSVTTEQHHKQANERNKNKFDRDYSKRSDNIEESVKQLGQRLTSLKIKRATSIPHGSELDVSTNEPPYTSTPVLTPVKENERQERYDRGSLCSTGSEKLMLMRQQLEENKARFARRSTSNQQLMQIVTKMKEKIGVTQQSLIETTELRKSMTDLTTAINDSDPRERHRSATDLSSRGSINIDRERNKYLENRVRLLEKQLNKERNSVQHAQERITALECDNERLQQSKLDAEASIETTKSDSIDDAQIDNETDTQVKLEMAKQIQDLQNQLAKLQDKCCRLESEVETHSKLEVNDNSVSDKISELESIINSLRVEVKERDETIKKQEDEIAEKTIELNILNANVNVLEEKLANSVKNKPLFSASENEVSFGLKSEVQQLKQKLDENNKAMIKLKLKCKQFEKQAEKKNEGNDLQQEVSHLSQANESLQKRITELEYEKEQWQLTTVNEATSDVGNQQTEVIRLLEEQKLDLQKELQNLQQEKDSARVKSELTEAQMEEQLTHRVQELEQEHQEKLQALEKKLSHYVNENMELLDKIDKLSKSSSSAESIEIVERLTQQERAELDEFNKRLTHGESDGEDVERDATLALPSLVSELTQTDIAPEVSESLAYLREESTELKKKIELFTNERREVLAKMELLSAENTSLVSKLNNLTTEKNELEANALEWANLKSKLEKELEKTEKENEQLSLQVSESSVQKSQLSQELTSMQKSSEVVAALDTTEGATLFDKCERSLSKLNSELEAYRKANDKTAKFNVSKKLAKEAKNVYSQLSELLQKVKEASNAVETVTVVETVVAVTAPNGKALAEYEQLTAQNTELKKKVAELQTELEELNESFENGGHKQQQAITDITTEVQAKTTIQGSTELKKLQIELAHYEEQCIKLQSTVEDLRLQLTEANTALDEKTQQLSEQAPKILAYDALQTTVEELQKKINEVADVKDNKDLEELHQQLRTYEEECTSLQSTVEDLNEQLREANLAIEEKSLELNQEREELAKRNKQAEEFDRQINDKEMSHEKQVEQFTRLRRELEGKCETYEGEMAILQTLVAEQKQQLIEAYSENDHKMNLKLIELQQCNEELAQLRSELKKYQQRSVSVGEQLTKEISAECESLREALKVNKALAAQQVNELANKQETIETLNQQIIDLYKSMEESANQAFDKEDKIRVYQEEIEEQRIQLDNLRKGQEEQKTVVDKLLNELHTHKKTGPQLEAELQRLTAINLQLSETNRNLEQRGKEQLDKLKKYAATLKKRTAEYHDLEAKMNAMTTSTAKEVSSDEVCEFNVRIKGLTSQVNELEQALSEAKATIHKLNEELKHKIHVNMENRNAIKNLKHQLKEKAEEVFELQEKVQNTLQAAPLMQAAVPVQLDQVNDQMAEPLRLENELRQANDHLAKKDAELEQLHEQLRVLSEKNSEMTETIRQLCERLENSEKTINELEHAALNTATRSDDHVSANEQTIRDLKSQLESKSIKFEKSKEVIKQRNANIQILQRQLRELQTKLEAQPEEVAAADAENNSMFESLRKEHEELKERYLNEKTTFEATISRLETLHDGIQAKLQEDMSYIESLESENNQLKTRVATLEESVSGFEHRNSDTFERTKILEEQLAKFAVQSKKTEEDLLNRIKSLSDHDEAVSRSLHAAQNERDDLHNRLKNLQSEFDSLSSRHQKLIQDNQIERSNYEATTANEMQNLREQLTAHEGEKQRLRAVYDAKLAAKTTEVDELECELSEHMDRVNAEKRFIAEELEKSRDDCVKNLDDIVRLRESLHMLEQARTELEREVSWLRLQQEGAQHDQVDVQELRMQVLQDKTEIDHLRNQIETLATNHEQELQSLRQQLADLDTLGQNQTDDQVFIETENKRLTDLLAEKQALIENYERSHESTAELHRQLLEKQELNTHLQQDLAALQSELNGLRQSLATASPATEVISAPAMFFEADQAAPSPFDEIVQPRTIMTQLGVASPLSSHLTPTVPDLVSEQPTIEDLQRNVSDLEKHAQDLETKLATRNQLVAEYEERLRDYKVHDQQNRQQLAEMQRALEERDTQLRQLSDTQGETHATEQHLQQLLAALQTRQSELEGQLRASNQEIAQLKAALEERGRLEAIDKQIQAPTVVALEEQPPTLVNFFGTPDTYTNEAFGLPQTEPVVEEVIRPKRAYICHPEAKEVETTDAGIDWGVDEDPWANAAEAAVTTSNFMDVSSSNTNQRQIEAELQKQIEQVRHLECKLQTSEQQRQELQVKSVKLMKKLKELKGQIGNQQQQQSTSNDLDMAILDELKQQVDMLEAQLIEQKKLNANELLEKEKLKKRIDVLTAGNDRMSEMKEKQDRDVQMYQARIRELQDQLNRLSDWGGEQSETHSNNERVDQQMSQLSSSQPTAITVPVNESTEQAKIVELQAEIQDLNCECQELKGMLKEEKSNSQRTQDVINALQQELSAVKEAATIGKATQATYTELQAEHRALKEELVKVKHAEQQLREQLESLRAQHELLQQQTLELTTQRENEKQELLKYKEQSERLQSEVAATATITSSATESTSATEPLTKDNDEYILQLEEKESEIVHLKHRIDNLMREDQTEKLVLEILTKNQEIHMLKLSVKQLEEDKHELTEQLQATPVTSSATTELDNANKQLQDKLVDLEKQNKLLEQEKSHMEEELRILNDHVMSTLEMEDKLKNSVLELDIKNIEITELRKSLDAIQSNSGNRGGGGDIASAIASTTNTSTQEDIAMLNQRWEQIVEQKCNELAQQWQDYMSQRELAYKSVESELRAQINALNAEVLKSSNDTTQPEGVSNVEPVSSNVDTNVTDGSMNTDMHITDMKKVLEEQEVEIVMLKEQLAIRSAEYGRLAAQYDPFKLHNTQTAGAVASANEDLQKKLDKALYMLHERDMHCEEMTVELGQLLNERDTLQLKLSDTLRQVESIKAQANYVDGKPTAMSNIKTATAFADSPHKIMTTIADTTATSDARIELNQKLSQLQTVNHSKDKAIVEEREQREREMGQLQKDVAKLPPANVTPEAVAIDFSQRNRSPSTGLLNWLMGNNKASGAADGSPTN